MNKPGLKSILEDISQGNDISKRIKFSQGKKICLRILEVPKPGENYEKKPEVLEAVFTNYNMDREPDDCTSTINNIFILHIRNNHFEALKPVQKQEDTGKKKKKKKEKGTGSPLKIVPRQLLSPTSLIKKSRNSRRERIEKMRL